MNLEPRIATQADAFRLLSRQIAEDAMAAGWLRPVVAKQGRRGPIKKIFAVADLRRVEDRILAGEYPGATEQPK